MNTKTETKTRILAKVAVFSFAALSVASATAQAESSKLTAGSLKKLFPGQYEASVQGYKVLFTASSDGRLAGWSYGREDNGRWFLRGNSLCVLWKQWTEGKSKCASVTRSGGWLVASDRQGQLIKFRRVTVAQN